ncbi:hypothetical protein ACIRPP_22055 [Streptomyces sp. NPDC101219]|uniref:hypothetical protein n=1 Tax=Streptomyces sp. NPDC101219 TaxID=3366131 RepID=UPI003830291B
MSDEPKKSVWKHRRVDELFEINSGITVGPARKPVKRTRGYLRVANVQRGRIDLSDVMDIEELPGDDQRYAVAEGDLLVVEGHANPNEIGRCAVAGADSAGLLHQNHLFRLRGERIIPRLAAELLNSANVRRYWLANAGTSSGLYTISRRALAALMIPDIPACEQREIVAFLDSLASSERSAEAMIEKLNIARNAILLKGMSSVVEPSARAGWERVPLKEIVPSIDYGISCPLNRDSRGLPTLRMNNLKEGRPYLADLRYCSQPVHPRLILRDGDVLFNRTNSMEHVGRAGVWRGELKEATFASYLVRLNIDANRVMPQYLVEWLQHPVIRQRVQAVATVAVQQVNVNPSRLRELKIDVPIDLAEQRRFVATLAACDRRIHEEVNELNKLRILKRTLASELLDEAKISRAA